MPIITAIKRQKRKDYFNLYVDDEFACGLTAQAVLDEGLAKGQEISREEIDRIVKEHEVNKLLDKALNWLSFRPHSTKELRDYLKKPKGKFLEVVSDQAQQQVFDRIVQKGYIEDAAFARWWIESRNRFRPRSRRLLQLELQQKGIDRSIIEQVFDELASSVESSQQDEFVDPDTVVSSDFDLALGIAQKNLRKYQRFEPREAKQKMAGLLARRGFSSDVIKPVVDQVCKNE